MTGFEKVVNALEERGLLVSASSERGVAKARCPSHDDLQPSLSVGEGDEGKALVYCFAGCGVADIVADLDLSWGDLFKNSKGHAIVQAYVYTDEEGQPLFRVLRTDPKGFTQERWEDGEWKYGLRETRRVLYNLPAVLRADRVWVVEGEKDVLSLAVEGEVATTSPGGASNWRDEYADYLRGKDVVITGDRDEPGSAFVSRVRLALSDVARSVRVLEVHPDAHDVSDHLELGYSLDELTEEQVDLSVFAPVDWQTYETEDTEWLLKPWVPVRGRVLAFGAAGSLKSLWAMWLAARLSREGRRCAYFSMEMSPSDTVKRLRHLNPDPKNFICFTKNLELTNPNHLDRILLGLKGFDLIVIDSWSAVHQFGSQRMSANDEVAAMDREVFQPLMERTGATVLMIDNVGHPSLDKGKVTKPKWARGASAKGDKMEVCLYFERPIENNNYRTVISCTKMRLDHPMPLPVTIETPRDRIEFYYVGTDGFMGDPMWPSLRVLGATETTPSPQDTTTPKKSSAADADNMTPFERRALARLKDKFKVVEA